VAEAGELLKLKGREGARDADPWRKYSQDMIDASLIARKAAAAQDKEGVLASGEALNDSCNGCHRTYDVE
jgi:cytochrome c556